MFGSEANTVNYPRVTEEIPLQMREHSELVGCTQAALKGRWVALSASVRKGGRSSISDVCCQWNQPEKEWQVKPKENQRERIVKVRVEINSIESTRTTKPRVSFLKVSMKFMTW